jgi:hypothetical protein
VKAMQQNQRNEGSAHPGQSDKLVAGLIDDTQAERVAERLSAQGIPARVADGGFAAEGRFGSRVIRGALAGALIALPIAIVLPLLAWSRNHAGVGPLVPVFTIGAVVVAIGAGLGTFLAVARGARQVEEPSAVVMAKPHTPMAAEEAAETIQSVGGQQTDPLVERGTDVRPVSGRPHLG